MKPDNQGSTRPGSTRLDDVERAHLVDPSDASYRIGRWGPGPELDELVRRFWVPVWWVPPGAESPQRVLQYPVCLIVVSNTYARFYGVVTGLSETVLTGDGWAVGVMLTPGAGGLLTGDVATWTDRFDELSEVFGESGSELASRVRAEMAAAPGDEETQRRATDIVEEWLRGFLPLDDDGRLVNAIVEYVENDSTVVAVAQICDRFHLTERSLQRLTRRRLGLTPKWLIQRRRLHEAAERLRERTETLASLAAELSYADEAHFVRDFKTVTGMTPRTFSARFGSGRFGSGPAET
ncbi:AraC family transcriptional regulator [Gordonia sp. zg691]|uniref:AraC family transcriptional regulator n=1 Tax=Gordonia jinghuaiqii TaxID=2758710 RepID=A0A7D7LTG9_9ACTN|nr:helix-turn-helix domain-containing protein [Gordonia jinghuaiqii]MBD0862950.1 AraC family transcriptional regulator [Gordonia jinghuaiqii]MCR5978925.1 helix-turn-helix domain-containing protein [Gordonia jinghuaiqii]QMT01737.1 AraC family transcriptional regulator [Gordonia jinghuaiqii]